MDNDLIDTRKAEAMRIIDEARKAEAMRIIDEAMKADGIGIVANPANAVMGSTDFSKYNAKTGTDITLDDIRDTASDLVRNFKEEYAAQANAGKKQSVAQKEIGAAVGSVANLISDKIGDASRPVDLSKANIQSNAKGIFGTPIEEVAAEQFARAAPEILGEKGKVLYEAITGREYYSERDITEMKRKDPRLAEKIEDAQDTFVTNVLDDLGDLAIGIPSAGLAAIRGGKNSLREGYEEGGVKGALKELGSDTLRVLGQLTGASLQGIKETVQDPTRKLADEPLSFLGDLSTAVGIGGALKAPTIASKAIGVAAELSPIPIAGRSNAVSEITDGLSPTTLAQNALRDAAFSTKNQTLKDAMQYLVDAKAGVDPKVIDAVDDYQRNRWAKINVNKQTIEDALAGKSADDKKLMRDILAAESTRIAQPDWPDKFKYLKSDANKLIKEKLLTQEQVKYLANNDPKALDDVIAQLNNNTIQTAEGLARTLAHRDIYVINKTTGEDIGSLGYMLAGGKINPEDVEIKVNPNSPFAAQATELKDDLEAISKIWLTIGSEATEIPIGNGKKLLPGDVLAKHQTYYMPDYYGGKKKDVEELQSVQRSGSQFAASVAKNKMTFAERLKLGAQADMELALKGALVSSINDVERYKLYAQVAERALTKADIDKLPAEEASKYVRFKTDEVHGTKIPMYGELAGKYVDRNTYNYIANIDGINRDIGSRFAKFVKRFGESWKSSKVLWNLPSWFNATIGNLHHNLVDGGIIGTAQYAKGLQDEVLRGMKLLKNDEYISAAKAAGIISDRSISEIGDVLDVQNAVRKDGLINGVFGYLDPRNWKNMEVEDGILRPYETLIKENPVARRISRMFTGIDTASKLAIFERFIRREAAKLNVEPNSLLKDPAALTAAQKHMENFHFEYTDTPLLLQKADKYLVLPFTRYAWKSIGAGLEVAQRSPATYRSAIEADKMVYENEDARGKQRIDIQPAYTIGRRRPWDETNSVNMRYMSPYSRIQDILAYKEPGDYGPDQFQANEGDFQVGGPLADLIRIVVQNKDPMTGRNLEDIDRTRADALARMFAPGEYYQMKEKRIPAIQAMLADQATFTDIRGRKQDPLDALLHSAGIKFEKDELAKLQKYIDVGIRQRLDDIKNNERRALNAASAAGREERDKIHERFKQQREYALEQRARRLRGAK